jgi:hypothetical protein
LMYGDKERAKAEGVVHKMVKRAVEMEGTVTVSPTWYAPGVKHLLTRHRANTVSAW